MSSTLNQSIDENNCQIRDISSQIDTAILSRDYGKAEILQKKLERLEIQHSELIEASKKDEISSKIEELERQKLQEENEVKKQMNEKMQIMLENSRCRLEIMKQRHREELAALDRKFNNPIFGGLRISPSIQALLRAEQFYVKNRNFQMANAIKYQITQRTEYEINSINSNSGQTVQAKVTATLQRQEIEMQGFRDKLETNKNNLKKETNSAILRIHNKYEKLRQNILGKKYDPFSSKDITTEEQPIFDTIDKSFSKTLSQATIEFHPSEPSSSRQSHRSIHSSHTARSINPRVKYALERSFKQQNLYKTTPF